MSKHEQGDIVFIVVTDGLFSRKILLGFYLGASRSLRDNLIMLDDGNISTWRHIFATQGAAQLYIDKLFQKYNAPVNKLYYNTVVINE